MAFVHALIGEPSGRPLRALRSRERRLAPSDTDGTVRDARRVHFRT